MKVVKSTSIAKIAVPVPTYTENALVVNTAQLLAQTQRCVIKTQDDAERATSLASLIADTLSKAEKERKALTSPLRDVIERINARYKQNITDTLTQAKTTIREKLEVWMKAQREKARKEEERLWAQQQRALENNRLKQADALAVKASVAQSAQKARTFGAIGGSSTLRNRWDWEVVDLAQVPVAFLQIDSKAVTEHLLKGAALIKEGNMSADGLRDSIPGVRIFESESVVIR